MKKASIVIIILFLFLLIGCKGNDIINEGDKELQEVENEKSEEYEIIEETVIKEGIPSPISGIYALEEKVNRRPVVIMFDNHPKARWQSGIGQGEIVYEFMVEAPYTRYMGVFLINEPESLGPIRSSRPYFVTTLLEYDPVYVRVGGSPQAKKDIYQLKIADIDGLSSSNKVLWKNNKVNKKAPHNTYTSMEVVRKTQEDRNFKLTGDYEGFKFYEDDTNIEGFTAKEILIKYFSNNTTFYKYNPEEKVYYRQKDGVDHIDELDKSLIKVKNIIIQEAKTKVIDKEGRLSIDLIGEGKGKYITNGKGIDIKWSKASRKSKTFFYDEKGKEITLNPGATWIQVVNIDPNIDIK